MIRPWSLLWLLATPLLPACSPAPPAAPRPAAEAPRPTLDALADQIARGAPPPRPLFASLPQGIQDEIRTRVGSAAGDRLELARQRLSRFNIRLQAPETGIPVLEGIYLAEGLAFGPPGPAQIQAAALLVTFHEMVFTTLRPLVGMQPLFGGPGGPGGPDDPIAAFWRFLVREGPGQQAALAAQVLRGKADEASIQSALVSRARTLPHDQLALRRTLQQEVVARPGATAVHWLDLADTLLLTGDPAATLRALEQSAAAPQPPQQARALAARKEALAEKQKRLVEIRALDGATSPEQRLRRASLLLLNRDTIAAREAYTKLRADLPDDARPVVGAARAEMFDLGDFGERLLAQKKILQAASGMKNRDADYYGLMIGLTGLEISDILRSPGQDEASLLRRLLATLGEIEALNREHARFAPERAAILGFILTSIRDGVSDRDKESSAQDRLARACASAIELAARYPSTPDAYRLRLGCATPLPSAQAFEVIKAPPPAPLAQDPHLAILRARALLGLVARHQAFDRLPEARAAVDAIPGKEDDQSAQHALLAADALVLGALGKSNPWQQAFDALQKARALDPALDNDRLSNNLAVATLLLKGDPQEGADRLKEAIRSNDRTQLARVNLATLALRHSTPAEALDLLQPLLHADPPPLAARLLAARVGRESKDEKLAREQALEALKTLKKEDGERYPGLQGDTFVEAKGSFNVSLKLKIDESSYELDVSSFHEPVLLLSSGMRHADLVALATPGDRNEQKPAGKKPPPAGKKPGKK